MAFLLEKRSKLKEVGGDSGRKSGSRYTAFYNSSPRRIDVELDPGGPAVKGRTWSTAEKNRAVG
jgi:hypothetical protein